MALTPHKTREAQEDPTDQILVPEAARQPLGPENQEHLLIATFASMIMWEGWYLLLQSIFQSGWRWHPTKRGSSKMIQLTKSWCPKRHATPLGPEIMSIY